MNISSSKDRISRLSLVGFCFFYNQVIFAATDPAYLSAKGIRFTPQLMAGTGYDTNLFRDTREVSSTVMLLKPSLDISALSGPNEYSLNIEALNRTYTKESEANSTDLSTRANINHEFTEKNRFELKTAWGQYYDEGVEVRSERRFPKFTRWELDGRYGYGTKGRGARIDLFGGLDRRSYKETEFNNRVMYRYGSTFYYNVMPSTDVLLEISQKKLDYNKAQDADYTVTNYLAGVSWEITGKTTGYAKGGRRFRKAQASEADKEGYTGWELGLSYAPVEYSLLQLTYERDYDLESDRPQNREFVRGDTLNTAWQHNWTEKVMSQLGWAYIDEKVMNETGIVEKTRKVKMYNAELNWAALRWITISLQWSYSTRDEKIVQPSATEDDYRRHRIMLSGRFSL